MSTNKERITKVSGSQVTGLPDQEFSKVDIDKEQAKAHLEELLDEHREMLIESIERMKKIDKNPDVKSLRTRLGQDEE